MSVGQTPSCPTAMHPTAVFFLKGFAQEGIRVPDDIAVIGWGDTTGPHLLNPTLTLLAMPIADIDRGGCRYGGGVWRRP